MLLGLGGISRSHEQAKKAVGSCVFGMNHYVQHVDRRLYTGALEFILRRLNPFPAALLTPGPTAPSES